MTEPVLIIGATSAIARALARALAAAGHDLYLAARDADELARLAADLHVRFGVRTAFGSHDIADTNSHENLLAAADETLGGFGGVVMASGLLGDWPQAREDDDLAARVFAVNFTAPALFLNRCARRLEAKGGGFIVGIGSVAGDRGRQSNYIYGASKGGFALYLQGLRNRLYRAGVHVMTVKPGFVDTAMTYGLPGLFLVASPEAVASDIMRGLRRRRDVIYTPWFWFGILWIIRQIPERLFKRLSL
ncbi:SDR family oxidoreductase [Acidihalobacter prosperus]|uniref:Sorbitol-6-phosphate 2-dehydrogenase n=1 Tax=Acidihalobacter prosperus TaxID=160660 RepID=A0A1A6C7Z5_9GAMM|nr:SDR family oxidoreductase [Acidihalobacter prosperus]OBS10687.1 Sorbitol-6-phosphate 2-dehydrogenase [Acidihalobacter prosperus]